jgi:hypothetical protein
MVCARHRYASVYHHVAGFLSQLTKYGLSLDECSGAWLALRITIRGDGHPE